MTAIPTTTVPQVVIYLQQQIDGALKTSGEFDVLLCVGEPGVDAPPDIIEVCSEVRREVAPLALTGGGGPLTFQEEYVIDCVVSSRQTTVDIEADDEALMSRAWQLLSYIETVIRTDLSLGGLVIEAYPQSSVGGAPVWSDDETARICEIVLPIHVDAAI